MPRYIMDEETDDLLERLTLMHCVCYYNYDTGRTGAITSYDEARAFFSQDDLTLIGHNIVRFDIPAAQKVLRIQINARLIDTLALSWYLYPLMKEHGLAVWGEFYHVPKPVVSDWRGLTEEERQIIKHYENKRKGRP